jgi:protein phosphatase
MTLTIPELSLVVLVGASGSGKSSFARKHFRPTEVLSSDFCRGLIADDETDQTATGEAFDVLRYIAGKRLTAGRVTVVDATNVQDSARKPLVELARKHHVIPVAIVLQLPDALCHERNKGRPDRTFGPHVVRQQNQQLRRSLKSLKREGFRHIYVLDSLEAIDTAVIERQPLWNNKKHEHGPFDIVGDIHGCCDELEELLALLGYRSAGSAWQHLDGRKAIFVGDLVDRGPRILDTVRLVKGMVAAGSALCVPGNHDVKFMRALRGDDVKINHGLDRSLAEFAALPEENKATARDELVAFLDGLVSHNVLDDGKLVVAHAGLKQEYQGRGSGKVRDFCLYGETTGETDEFGLPVRCNWAAEYRGRAMVVYGHTPVPEAEWLNHTINIDTGCVFGGKLTALRYPERELVSVPAHQTYCDPVKPLAPAQDGNGPLTAQQAADDVLDLADVLGKRIIRPRLGQSVTIREEHAITALEVMSRFAVDPRWLIYLPPTMSPCGTSAQPGLLEHPTEAFDYFRAEGVAQVICQEKHMGSRAVVIVCRDEDAARRRFGTLGEGTGIVYTRTGRRFFSQPALEAGLLERLRAAITAAGLWEEFRTEWFCLDCELMPWSAKAQELLRDQYAAVGAAAGAALHETSVTLEQAHANGVEVGPLLERIRERAQQVSRYVAAYRHYCWPVHGLDDLRLAPFHVLASEGAVHRDRDHAWHLHTIDRLHAASGQTGCPLQATRSLQLDVTDETSVAAGVSWWEQLTGTGGEGMVVKPLPFVAIGRHGLVQPAVKVRGVEYLRIIYGPEYTQPEYLQRLRSRGLGHKRSLALREFALGVEALERFVRREPLRRVHECVFGVLAMESEPTDPRL